MAIKISIYSINHSPTTLHIDERSKEIQNVK